MIYDGFLVDVGVICAAIFIVVGTISGCSLIVHDVCNYFVHNKEESQDDTANPQV